MAAIGARRLWALAALVCIFLPAGCLPGSMVPPKVDYYTLDYPAPLPPGTPLDETIKIDRFSVAQAYNSSAMVYRPEAYRLAVYHYHRWRTNPGDMATDCLVRDFRSSRLFRALFSYLQAENGRLEMDGAVEEFLESREGDGWKAVLGLSVTLLDRGKSGISSEIVFQKQYRAVEPIVDRSPEGFARGMSAAMARLSAQIIREVREAANPASRPEKGAIPLSEGGWPQ
jgi:cholesterol transport system auxiliary component